MGRLVSKASFILGSAHRGMDEGREREVWREKRTRKGNVEGGRKRARTGEEWMVEKREREKNIWRER